MRRFLDHAWMDAKVGVRSLFRDRAFTIVAALTLAIGVALNAAMFSVVNAVLLRPPGYAEPDRLVVIDNLPPNAQAAFVSPAEFFDYRKMSRTVSEIAVRRPVATRTSTKMPKSGPAVGTTAS